MARVALSRTPSAGRRVEQKLGLGTTVWAAAALFGLNGVFQDVPRLRVTLEAAGAGFLLYVAGQLVRHAAVPLSLEDHSMPMVDSPS